VRVFHAGTALRDGHLVTDGGRVLGVTGLGDSFAAAKATAYRAVERIHFEGAYYRRDIAARVARGPA
jgi:phosphoribosylamine--glycine ligase